MDEETETRSSATGLPPWLAFVIGAAMFVGARWLAGAIPGESLAEAHPWLNQFLLKSILIVIPLLGSLILTRGALTKHGYRRPDSMKWWSTIWPGLLLGALGTTFIFITPAGGMDMARLGSGGVIVLLVLYSSFSEEIFARGFIQSLMGRPTEKRIDLPFGRVSVPALTSGLLFGSMHLSIYFAGSDALTTVIVVTYTTMLGIVAGHLFEKHRSIVPAIVVHIAANAGGMAAGVILTIARFLITGELPQQP